MPETGLKRAQEGYQDKRKEVLRFRSENREENKKVQDIVQKAINWVATEHNYMRAVRSDLELLKRSMEKPQKKGWASWLRGSDSARIIRKAMGDYRYIGRSERRAERFIEQAEDAIQNVISLGRGSASELATLKTSIETEAKSVLRETALYEGKIKQHMVDLQSDVRRYDKKGGEDYKGLIVSKLDDMFKEIDQVTKWMDALIIDLEKAQALSRRYLLALYPVKEATKYERIKRSEEGKYEDLATQRPPAIGKIVDLLRGTGAYYHYSEDARELIWNKWRKNSHSSISLKGVSFKGANLWSTKGFDLSGIDFSGCDFTGAHLGNANIVRADFSKATLVGAKLTNVKGWGANFADVDARAANFTGADLQWTHFNRAQLKDAEFKGANLKDASFEKTDLSPWVLRSLGVTKY
jgi:uncharacterized protein YjbI with pentapeptide repeats